MKIPFLVALLWASVALSSGPEGPGQPPTSAQAVRLFEAPRGSLSIGWASSGRLVRAAVMPRRGRGYSLLPFVPGRRTFYGTTELIALLQRAAAQVAERFDGSVLRIGNIGSKRGGKIHWSVSHQSGRDVDLGMYAIDLRTGKRVSPKALVGFGADGIAKRRYRFDDARNLELVVALAMDESAPVQWILVAEWLKQRMLKRARWEGRPKTVIERLDEMLQQPWLSSPHHDHFHVRIFCPAQDRLYGCLDSGRRWPWVRANDRLLTDRARELASLLKMPSARYRVRALKALRAIRASGVATQLVAALSDRARSVRKAALSAIAAIRDPDAVAPLAAALRETAKPGRARALLRVALKHRGTEVAALARRIWRQPQRALHPRLPPKASAEVRALALEYLGKRRDPRDLQPLVDTLATGPRPLRKAAARALRQLTANGPRRGTRGKKLDRWWVAWSRANGQRAKADWLTAGLARARYRLPPGSPLSPAAQRVMLRALRDRRVAVQHLASRLMTELTGFRVNPARRDKRALRRLWRTWWRLFARDFGPAPAARRPKQAIDNAAS